VGVGQSLNRTSNVVVAVSTDPGKVLSSQVIEKVQPAWMEEEYTLVERVGARQRLFRCVVTC
jgi:hypothetical protein